MTPKYDKSLAYKETKILLKGLPVLKEFESEHYEKPLDNKAEQSFLEFRKSMNELALENPELYDLLWCGEED